MVNGKFQSYHQDEETRGLIRKYLEKRSEKYGFEITRDLHPQEASELFYASLKGLPEDYHEGKTYIKKK